MKKISDIMFSGFMLSAALLLSGCNPTISMVVQVDTPVVGTQTTATESNNNSSNPTQASVLSAETTAPGSVTDITTAVAESTGEPGTTVAGNVPGEVTTAAPVVTPTVSDDPSAWSMQQIIDYYKAGMQKTDENHDCYSDQQMQLVGKLPGKAAAISGPVNMAMKLGSQPIDKLTGGYWDLVPDDLVSATAVKDGDYVVISLTPKEQTDGPDGDEHAGHVGHVVNVVQGIDSFLAYVDENFGFLNAHYTKEGVKIHYTNAFAKDVRINTKTGEMESGQWGYTIDLHIDDASVLGVSLNDFNATIQYDCWYPVED